MGIFCSFYYFFLLIYFHLFFKVFFRKKKLICVIHSYIVGDHWPLKIQQNVSVLLTKQFRDFKFDINFYFFFVYKKNIFFLSSYKPFSWINLLNCEQSTECNGLNVGVLFMLFACLFYYFFVIIIFVTIVKALLYFAELCIRLLMAGKIFIWLNSKLQWIGISI